MSVESRLLKKETFLLLKVVLGKEKEGKGNKMLSICPGFRQLLLSSTFWSRLRTQGGR